jgi:AraC-like DNA-binding protein
MKASDAAVSYDRWREETAPLLCQIYDVETDPARFYAAHAGVDRPGLTVSSFSYAAATYARTPERIKSAPLDHILIQSTASGGLTGEHDGRPVYAEAQSALIIDWGRSLVHHSVATVGRGLMIDRAAFGSADLDGLHTAMVRGARWRLLHDYMAWLMDALPDAPLSTSARTQDAVAAVVLACFDPTAVPEEQARDIMGGLALARARRFIDAQATSALTITKIASAAGVSRRTLYRLFEPFGGVMEYIWRARLEIARQRLSDHTVRGTIGEIAYAAGFEHQPHFSRRFLDVYGFSPRNLRPF